MHILSNSQLLLFLQESGSLLQHTCPLLPWGLTGVEKSDAETWQKSPTGTDCPSPFRVWEGRVRKPRHPLWTSRGEGRARLQRQFPVGVWVFRGCGEQPLPLCRIGKRTTQFRTPGARGPSALWPFPIRTRDRGGAGFSLSNTHLQPRPERPGASSSSAERTPQFRAWISPPGCALPVRQGGDWRNPWDQPDEEGAGAVPRLPSSRPPTPRAEGAPTHTYPSCRRGRTHSTPGPAPCTRSQLAVVASLASCELCAAGGSRRAPSPSAWVPTL